MTEKKLTVGAVIKTVVFIILAIIGFFVLWVITFFLSLALTFMNFGLSLILSLFISAVTIAALVTILTRKRSRPVPSKRQIVATYVICAIGFILGLPLMNISLLIFLVYSTNITFLTLLSTHNILRARRGMTQK